MATLKHPTSALQEYAQQMKLPVPVFEESRGVNYVTQKPEFSFTITFDGKTYGPAFAPSKNAAKTEAATMACDDLYLYHDGASCTMKALSKSKCEEPIKSIIVNLFEYCQLRKWPNPECKQTKEEGDAHDKVFYMQYSIGESKFPPGAGRSKDLAKRRAAARTLSELQGVHLREHIRGPISEISFGQVVAETAWETFGILCEELGQDEVFCRSSELCAFLLEDKETGLLRTLSLGTGNKVANEEWRVRRGESIVDAHALIIARRGLLVYFYDQLLKLIKKESASIFEFSGPDIRTLVCLQNKYDIHLYMKSPPCGDALWFNYNNRFANECEQTIEIRNDHFRFYSAGHGRGALQLKGEFKDIASCSDKVLLWNYVGLQGALLSNFVTPLVINSVTISNQFIPEHITRAFCCRLDPKHTRRGIVHPWMQHGTIDGINKRLPLNDWRNIWSIYWCHDGLELTDELQNLTENAGIIDGTTGCHLNGSEREGRIPIICKRNLLRSYRKVCLLAGAGPRFVHGKSYYEHKNMSVPYKTRKNDFFKQLDTLNLGRFPLMDRHVDDFYLQGDDQKENPTT